MRQNEIEKLRVHSTLEQLTLPLLYEGWLFPYHRPEMKNTMPVPFGVVYPEDCGMHHPEAPAGIRKECTVKGTENMTIDIKVRFLHLREKNILNPAGERYDSGREAVEREITPGKQALARLLKRKTMCFIKYPEVRESKLLYNQTGEVAGKQLSILSGLKGLITISALPVEGPENYFRVTVKIMNTTPAKNSGIDSPDALLSQSFLSTHAILSADGGEFITIPEPVNGVIG